jgi:hypothetical protein
MTPTYFEIWEIEDAFIAELQANGERNWRALSRKERSARVRIQIFKNNRQKQRFHESELTYSEAFQLFYGEKLEQRGMTRPDTATAFSENQLVGFPGESDDDEADDSSEFEESNHG